MNLPLNSTLLTGLIYLNAAVFFGLAGATQETPPNIVLIISDDQCWTDFGFMGHAEIQTPHLDRLASESALFTRGYVPTALCRPSLMTIITGRYAHQHRTSGNDPSPALAKKNSPEYQNLRARLIAHIDEYPTLPGLLGERGYVSHQSGKWWEGSYVRGGFTDGMTQGFPEPGGRHGDKGLEIGRKGMQPILQFVDQAVSHQKPFFIWYAPFLPHSPHNPPERLLKKYSKSGRSMQLAKYYAMCEWFDETCGQLLDHLRSKDLTDNTLVVFVTDNGWIQRTPETEVPENWRTSFAPRSKQSPNEGGVRTPIILSWPGKIPAGRRDELVSSIDLMPTLLAIAGADVPGDLPGVNLWPVVQAQGKPIQRETLFGEGFAHDIADLENPEASLLYRWCIQGQWKLLLTYDGVTVRYAPVHLREEKRPQLFDLLQDPHEKHNLAARHPGVVARLAALIEDWWPVKDRQVLTSF